jgi:hypothetical protein
MVVKPSESFMQGIAILSTGVCWHMTMGIERQCLKRMTEEKSALVFEVVYEELDEDRPGELNECGGWIPRSESEWMDGFPLRQRATSYTFVRCRKQRRNTSIP